MWIYLTTLLVILSTTVVLLSLTLRDLNKKKSATAAKSTVSAPKLCGDKYVVAQNKCLNGNPGNTASCFRKNAWSTSAQQCINAVDADCQKNCRPEDCPAYLQTPIYPGCSPC